MGRISRGRGDQFLRLLTSLDFEYLLTVTQMWKQLLKEMKMLRAASTPQSGFYCPMSIRDSRSFQIEERGRGITPLRFLAFFLILVYIFSSVGIGSFSRCHNKMKRECCRCWLNSSMFCWNHYFAFTLWLRKLEGHLVELQPQQALYETTFKFSRRFLFGSEPSHTHS